MTISSGRARFSSRRARSSSMSGSSWLGRSRPTRCSSALRSATTSVSWDARELDLLGQAQIGDQAAIALDRVIRKIADDTEPQHGADDILCAALDFVGDRHGPNRITSRLGAQSISSQKSQQSQKCRMEVLPTWTQSRAVKHLNAAPRLDIEGPRFSSRDDADQRLAIPDAMLLGLRDEAFRPALPAQRHDAVIELAFVNARRCHQRLGGIDVADHLQMREGIADEVRAPRTRP